MDDWIDPFLPPQPPSWSKRVRCRICGQIYGSHELYLNTHTDEFCCREWPICQGSGSDIELVDDDASNADTGR